MRLNLPEKRLRTWKAVAPRGPRGPAHAPLLMTLRGRSTAADLRKAGKEETQTHPGLQLFGGAQRPGLWCMWSACSALA